MARAGTWWVALAMMGAAAFALLSVSDTPAPLGRGSVATHFILPRVDGAGEVSLGTLRGRVVLLNFWATWCKPCEDEMPAMGRLYEALAGTGFELLAVSVDDGVEEVQRFQQRLALPFPVLLDRDKRVARDYQTYRFPESFLIDRDGVVIERYIGPKDWDAPAYVGRVRRLLEAGS